MTTLLLALLALTPAAPLPYHPPPAEEPYPSAPAVGDIDEGGAWACAPAPDPAPDPAPPPPRDVPRDDPLYGELLGYPPPAVVRSTLAFQDARIAHLEGRLKSPFDKHVHAGLMEALREQERRRALWDDLDTAQWRGTYLDHRRKCLGRVRAAGLPDPVDLATFDRGR